MFYAGCCGGLTTGYGAPTTLGLADFRVYLSPPPQFFPLSFQPAVGLVTPSLAPQLPPAAVPTCRNVPLLHPPLSPSFSLCGGTSVGHFRPVRPQLPKLVLPSKAVTALSLRAILPCLSTQLSRLPDKMLVIGQRRSHMQLQAVATLSPAEAGSKARVGKGLPAVGCFLSCPGQVRVCGGGVRGVGGGGRGRGGKHTAIGTCMLAVANGGKTEMR